MSDADGTNSDAGGMSPAARDALDEFIRRLRCGENPDRDALIAAYPDDAAELEQVLALEEELFRLGRSRCRRAVPGRR